MAYFSTIISENLKINSETLKINPDYFIKQRKNRELIRKSYKLKKFIIGDILEFVYSYRSIPLVFCGICIAIKRKSFVMPDLVLILRNIIIKTGIELTLSYFYNRGYNFKFLDYRRKFFTFNKNKLYFIRNRDNQESRIF
jgi:ribosomal protein L19